jgi:hypothetical protein
MTNRAPAWWKRSQAEPKGEARPRLPPASLASAWLGCAAQRAHRALVDYPD